MTKLPDKAKTAVDLQQELRDLLCLAIVGDHVRRTLTGEGTAGLAAWLRGAAVQWRAWADQVAAQLVALGVAPDSQVRSLAKDIHWNSVPRGWLDCDKALRLVADQLSTVRGWTRNRRSQATDPGTERLLASVCAGLEAQTAILAVPDVTVRPHGPQDPAGSPARARRHQGGGTDEPCPATP